MVESVAEVPLCAATLRYFDAAGSFAAAVAAAAGAPVPAPGHALLCPGLVLAWLRPTETLALSEDAAPLDELKERLAQAAGGHVVDLTGGLKGFRLSGAGAAQLLSRLGSTALALRVEEARRGRLADVPVLAVCLRAEETLLVVDRAYAEHLRGWIDATLADRTEG
jgi:heterotetrameric sarcosine oxidase gamma subunit